MIKTREYRPSDKATLVNFMDDFQEHLVAIDTMKRARKLPGYGKVAVARCLSQIKKNQGVIYIAEVDGKMAGFIAGILARESKEDSLSRVKTKAATVTELYIEENHRGKGVGKMLMAKMEKYLKSQGCDLVLVEVFEPNKAAHAFYSKLGYRDRMVYMIKKTRDGGS